MQSSLWNNLWSVAGLFDDIQLACHNVFVSLVYVLYSSTVIGIGLILLFIVLLLFYQCVIRDNKLFWIWIWIWYTTGIWLFCLKANIRCSGCSPLGENNCEKGLLCYRSQYYYTSASHPACLLGLTHSNGYIRFRMWILMNMLDQNQNCDFHSCLFIMRDECIINSLYCIGFCINDLIGKYIRRLVSIELRAT